MKPAYTAEQIRNILHAARVILFPESVRPNQDDEGEPVVYRLVVPGEAMLAVTSADSDSRD